MKRLVLTLGLCGLLLLTPFNAFADVQITLQWDPNTEPDLAGYRLYLRTDGDYYDYDDFEWQGSATQCNVPALNENMVYFFVVRAFDQEDNESGNSNEVCYPPEAEACRAYQSDLSSDYASLAGSDSSSAAGGGCFISNLINF